MLKGIGDSFNQGQANYLGKIDEDGNGSIDKKELQSFFTTRGFTDQEKIDEIFKKLDLDGNNQIETEELKRGLKSNAHRPAIALEVFQKIDADKSGSLNKSELKDFLTSRGVTDQAKIDEVFKIVDSDKNGELNVDEVKSNFRKITEKPASGTLKSMKSILSESAYSPSPLDFKNLFDIIKNGKENQLNDKDKEKYQPIMSFIKQQMITSDENASSLKGIFFDSSR